MPSSRTQITEIATALGMTGAPSLDTAFDQPGPPVVGVSADRWRQLHALYRAGAHLIDFEGAWRNGRAFRDATWGLRGRPPLRIEWKGPHKPPAYEFLPADLRVDHVFLVSCKHDSHILANTSPSHLFDNLQWGLIERRGTDWFAEVAPLEYQGFYEAVKAEMRGECVLPSTVGALTADDRRALKGAFRREWPPALRRPYEEFASAVSVASAARWKQALSTKPRKELAFWRLLRMGAAPYFLLGASDRERLRIRVATPWDWRQEFELVGFSVTPRAAGQPTVEWEARIRERASGQDRSVNGFVEVRWSHGRFMGAPEAKVQLVTAHSAVPGYFPLE